MNQIKSIWKSMREGKRSLHGSQLHQLATMLNTSAFNLSVRVEALVQLAHKDQGQAIRRSLLAQIDEMRKELSLCRDIGYYSLCAMRNRRKRSHATRHRNG
jgi:hypothetical protein